MIESKMELKNWKRWKNTLRLLFEAKEKLEQLNSSETLYNNYKIDKIHQDIHQKCQTVFNESKKYQLIINDYQFFIDRLESAITDLLNEDEKKVVIIYANNPDNALAREYEALQSGISRTTYYKQLSEACKKLDKVLTPAVDFNINDYIAKSSKEL